jgi:hypothetical protein
MHKNPGGNPAPGDKTSLHDKGDAFSNPNVLFDLLTKDRHPLIAGVSLGGIQDVRSAVLP